MKIILNKPKPYSIIYADPCWEYSNKKTGGSFSSGAEDHYPTMSVAELCNMDVEAIAADDSFCFMWTTGPYLLSGEAATVMSAWGFTPKTIAFVWIKTDKTGKPVNGMGFYSRSCVEYVLLGKRGFPERYSASVGQLIESEDPITLRTPRLRHSEKPPETRSKIIELCGNLKRIELFSRHEVPTWDRMGNELLP